MNRRTSQIHELCRPWHSWLNHNWSKTFKDLPMLQDLCARTLKMTSQPPYYVSSLVFWMWLHKHIAVVPINLTRKTVSTFNGQTACHTLLLLLLSSFLLIPLPLNQVHPLIQMGPASHRKEPISFQHDYPFNTGSTHTHTHTHTHTEQTMQYLHKPVKEPQLIVSNSWFIGFAMGLCARKLNTWPLCLQTHARVLQSFLSLLCSILVSVH